MELLAKTYILPISNVYENVGGILGITSLGYLQRNINEAHNLKKKKEKSSQQLVLTAH